MIPPVPRTSEIHRQLIAVYGFPELPGKPGFCQPPDGVYPMAINGEITVVRVESGAISCGQKSGTSEG